MNGFSRLNGCYLLFKLSPKMFACPGMSVAPPVASMRVSICQLRDSLPQELLDFATARYGRIVAVQKNRDEAVIAGKKEELRDSISAEGGERSLVCGLR